MKKLLYYLSCSFIFIVIILFCFTNFSCNKSSDIQAGEIAKDNKNSNLSSGDPESIDLQSILTQPPTVIVQSGCVATYFADLQINNPVANQLTAVFKVVFSIEGRGLSFSVEQINNQPPQSHSPLQSFTLQKGQSLLLKLKFTFSNQDYDFNRSYIVKGKIDAVNFGFTDPNPANDLLTQETFIGSPNTICSECLETATLLQNIQYSFFIPVTVASCQNNLAILSSTATEAELKLPATKAELSKAYFQFIQNGFIPNTTINSVLIKNPEGKYLTYNNGVPAFMNQITNDIHSYQRWVVLKPTTSSCSNSNHLYKFVQYLDNNTCKELVQTQRNGKYYLVYRSGISRDNIADKYIMEPKAQVIIYPTTPK